VTKRRGLLRTVVQLVRLSVSTVSSRNFCGKTWEVLSTNVAIVVFSGKSPGAAMGCVLDSIQSIEQGRKTAPLTAYPQKWTCMFANHTKLWQFWIQAVQSGRIVGPFPRIPKDQFETLRPGTIFSTARQLVFPN
jgi:hypothetical protein